MKLNLLRFLFLLLITTNCLGQLPYLVKDINTGTSDGLPNGFYPFYSAGIFYFSGQQSTTGYEIWRTDGTTAGTYLIKDINPGTTSSNPSAIFEFNGSVYFSATNSLNGKELWKTNGTTAGTVLVKDILTGSGSGISILSIVWQHNGFFYFNARSAATTDNELWRSDGTTAGTTKLKDINPGASGSSPSNFFEFNGQLYFSADNGSNGEELWKTDGTTAGTSLVKDIYAGTNSGLANLFVAWQHNGFFYFTAYSASGTDNEFWKSDGTTAGTTKLKDINPGASGSYPSSFIEFNGELIFVADNGSIGKELWKTDGTTAGTLLVKDIYVGAGNGIASFYENWVHNGFFYFNAYSASATDSELWKTDGTTAGTTKVKDIYPGALGSNPSSFFEFNNQLFFTADNGTNGEELWKTDGTTAGTALVKDIYAGSGDGLTSLYVYWEHAGFFYFNATSASSSDFEIWKSDGTTAGTSKLKDIYPGATGSSPTNFYTFNNQLFFRADNSINGVELWKTDGTTSGTAMVKDIYTGANTTDSNPFFFAVYNGYFYFTAASLSSTNREIWKSDGTTAGTTLVLDIYSGITGSNPNYFTVLNNTYLLFSATNASAGEELWAFNMAGIANDILTEATTLDIKVFPNPASDYLVVNSIESGLTIHLFDLSGKRIKETTSQETSTQIDVSDCSPGMYFLQCRKGTAVLNRKIIIE